MKVVLTLVCLFFSVIVSANILVDIRLDLKGKKSNISKEIKLAETQNILLKSTNLKVNYILSNKKPVDFPKDYMWTKDSVFLKAEILDLKTSEITATPQVMTIYGKKAIMEMSNSEDMNKTFLKIEFTPTKL